MNNIASNARTVSMSRRCPSRVDYGTADSRRCVTGNKIKSRRHTRRSPVRVFLACALFFAGVSIMLYPPIAQYVNNQSATELVAIYQEAVSSDPGEAGGSAQTGIVIGADTGEEVFGSIFIPALGLELPIYVGSTSANLSKGIAHLEGTSLPVGGESTHCVLAGHNGAVTNEWFTNIDKMKSGDLFYIRHGSSVLTYEVVSSKVIEPNDASDLVIEPGRDLVTLLTCTDSGMKRLIVRGERTA